VDWEAEPVTITANDALAAEAGGTAARPSEEAESFLLDLLADGPVHSKQVEKEAREASLAWRTVRRAKDKLGVQVRRAQGMEGRGPWSWSLPTKAATSEPSCPSNKVANLDNKQEIQAVQGDEKTFSSKVATQGNGHLSDPPSPDTPSDGDPFAGLKDPSHSLPASHELDLPDFLDRRQHRGTA
jgi:hypothetical protein